MAGMEIPSYEYMLFTSGNIIYLIGHTFVYLLCVLHNAIHYVVVSSGAVKRLPRFLFGGIL